MSPYFRRLGPQYVLNEISMKLKKEEKLPAICFVFSRAKVEYYGNALNILSLMRKITKKIERNLQL